MPPRSKPLRYLSEARPKFIFCPPSISGITVAGAAGGPARAGPAGGARARGGRVRSPVRGPGGRFAPRMPRSGTAPAARGEGARRHRLAVSQLGAISALCLPWCRRKCRLWPPVPVGLQRAVRLRESAKPEGLCLFFCIHIKSIPLRGRTDSSS